MTFTKRFGRGLAVAALVAATATTTALVAYADDDKDDQVVEQTEDEQVETLEEGDTEEAEGEFAGGLPEDLPEQAAAARVLEVIENWEGERGSEFGAAVSEAAKAKVEAEAGDPGDDAEEGDVTEDEGDDGEAPAEPGSQADDKRQDEGKRPAQD